VKSGLTRIFHELQALIGKAFRAAVVLRVPIGPDNAANARLRLARRVEIFQASVIFNDGDKVFLTPFPQIGM
jgi:hypothetical protein